MKNIIGWLVILVFLVFCWYIGSNNYQIISPVSYTLYLLIGIVLIQIVMVISAIKNKKSNDSNHE